MRYAPYQSYCDTAEKNWIGRIPIGWKEYQIKRKFRIVNGSTPQASEPLYWDGDITWVTPADFRLAEAGYLSTSAKQITLEGYSACGTTLVPKDSLILSTRAPIGSVAQAGGELCTNQGCKALVRDAEDVHERFVYYGLSVSSHQLNALGSGSTFMELSSNDFGYYCIPHPSFPEQQKIAAFLDWKTGQIDALIARKTELLEKLKEKRIAVITQAVTKGLNPDAPTRDSGIPWLGQVPQHWIVKRLRYSAALVTSGSRGWAQHFADSGELFLRITNLSRESIELLLEDIQRVEPPDGAEGARTLTKAGDLLISIIADLGSVAVIPSGLEPAYVSQHLSLVRIDTTSIDPNWIAYSIFSHAGKYQLRMAGYGGTKVQLSLGDIKEIRFCHPPTVEEQQDILRFIRVQTKQTDDLIDLTSQAIDRLNEYRTALITAATTGKIDVRNVKIPAPA